MKRVAEAYLRGKKSPIHLDNEMMWVPLSINRDEGGAHKMPDGARYMHIGNVSIVAGSTKEKETCQEAE